MKPGDVMLRERRKADGEFGPKGNGKSPLLPANRSNLLYSPINFSFIQVPLKNVINDSHKR